LYLTKAPIIGTVIPISTVIEQEERKGKDRQLHFGALGAFEIEKRGYGK
jgi:hypothetical protein